MEKLLRHPGVAAVTDQYPPQQRQAILIAAGLIAVKHTLTLCTHGNTGTWDDKYSNEPHLSFCFAAYDTDPMPLPYGYNRNSRLALYYQSDDEAVHSHLARQHHSVLFAAHNDNKPYPNFGHGKGIIMGTSVRRLDEPEAVRRAQERLRSRHIQAMPWWWKVLGRPIGAQPAKLGDSRQFLYQADVHGIQVFAPQRLGQMPVDGVAEVLAVLDKGLEASARGRKRRVLAA